MKNNKVGFFDLLIWVTFVIMVTLILLDIINLVLGYE